MQSEVPASTLESSSHTHAASLAPSPGGARPSLPAPLLAAAVVAFAGLALAWSSALPGVFYDDGIYALLGKSMAEGHGLHYLGVPGAPPAAKYPPFFPLLLAGIWRLVPPPGAFVAFELLNVLLAVLGAAAFADYLQRGLGYPRAFAALLAIAAWLTVDTWRYAVIPLSEPLFTLALVLALLAASRLERAGAGLAALACFLAAFAAAYHARTIGVVAGLAAVTALLSRRRWRAALALAAGLALVVLPWTLWTWRASHGVPSVLADVLGPYSDWLGAQVRSAPAAFAASVLRSLPALGGRLLEVVLPGVPAALGLPAALALGAVAVAGARDLLPRSRSTVLAALFFVGVLALWPFVTRRLVAPLAPWLILFVAAGFLAGSRAGSRPLRMLCRASGVLWALWLVGNGVTGLVQRRHDQVLVARSAELRDAATAVVAATPPDAVVGSAELWAGIYLLTGRTVTPSARFRTVSDGAPVWGTPAQQLELWRFTGMRYLWVAPGAPIEAQTLDALARACGPGAISSVARSSRGALLRLNATPACPGTYPAALPAGGAAAAAPGRRAAPITQVGPGQSVVAVPPRR